MTTRTDTCRKPWRWPNAMLALTVAVGLATVAWCIWQAL